MDRICGTGSSHTTSQPSFVWKATEPEGGRTSGYRGQRTLVFGYMPVRYPLLFSATRQGYGFRFRPASWEVLESIDMLFRTIGQKVNPAPALRSLFSWRRESLLNWRLRQRLLQMVDSHAERTSSPPRASGDRTHLN